jgi:hypothetical protein
MMTLDEAYKKLSTMVASHDDLIRFHLDSSKTLVIKLEDLRALLAGYKAAKRDLILAVSGHRCDICVNDKCHYNDDEEIVACSAGMFMWRGPEPGASVAKEDGK